MRYNFLVLSFCRKVPEEVDPKIASQIDKLQKENDFLRDTNKKLGTNNLALQRTVDTIQKQINEFQELASMNDSLMQENRQLKSQASNIDELANENDLLKTNNQAMAQEIQRLRSYEEPMVMKEEVQQVQAANPMLAMPPPPPPTEESDLESRYKDMVAERDRLKVLLMDKALQTPEGQPDIQIDDLIRLSQDNENLRKQNAMLQESLDSKTIVPPVDPSQEDYREIVQERDRLKLLVLDQALDKRDSGEDTMASLEQFADMQNEIEMLKQQNEDLQKARELSPDLAEVMAERDRLRLLVMDQALDREQAGDVAALKHENDKLKEENTALKEGLNVQAAYVRAVAGPEDSEEGADINRLRQLLMDKALDKQYIVQEVAVASEDVESLRKENDELKSENFVLREQLAQSPGITPAMAPTVAATAAMPDDARELALERDRMKQLLMDQHYEIRHIIQEVPQNQREIQALQREVEQLELENQDLRLASGRPPSMLLNMESVPAEDYAEVVKERDRLKALLLDAKLQGTPSDDLPVRAVEVATTQQAPAELAPADYQNLMDERDRVRLLVMDQAVVPRSVVQERLVTSEELEELKKENERLRAMIDDPNKDVSQWATGNEDLVKEIQRLKQLLMDKELETRYVVQEVHAGGDASIEPTVAEVAQSAASPAQSRQDGYDDLIKERDHLKMLLMDKAQDTRLVVQERFVSAEDVDALLEQNKLLEAQIDDLKKHSPMESGVGTDMVPRPEYDAMKQDRDRLKLLMMDNALEGRYIVEERAADGDLVDALRSENADLKNELAASQQRPPVIVEKTVNVQAAPPGDGDEVRRLRLLVMDQAMDRQYIVQETPANVSDLAAANQENMELKEQLHTMERQEPVMMQQAVPLQAAPPMPQEAPSDLANERDRLRQLLMDKALDTRYIVQETPANAEELAALEKENADLRREVDTLRNRPPLVVEKTVNVQAAAPADNKDDLEKERLKQLLMDKALDTKYIVQEMPANAEDMAALENENASLRNEVDTLRNRPPLVVEKTVNVQAAAPADNRDDLEKERLKQLLMDKALDTKYIVQEMPANAEDMAALENENASLRNEVDTLRNRPPLVVEKTVNVQAAMPESNKDDLERERLKLLLMDKALDTRYIVQETPMNAEELTALEKENTELQAQVDAIRNQPPLVVEKVMNVQTAMPEPSREDDLEKERLRLLLMDKALDTKFIVQEMPVNLDELAALEKEKADLQQEVDTMRNKPPVVVEKVVNVQAAMPEINKEDDPEKQRLKLLLLDKALDTKYIVQETPANAEDMAALHNENASLRNEVDAMRNQPPLVMEKVVNVQAAAPGPGKDDDMEKERLRLLLMDKALDTKYIVQEAPVTDEELQNLQKVSEELRAEVEKLRKSRPESEHAAVSQETPDSDLQRLRLLLMDKALDTRYVVQEAPATSAERPVDMDELRRLRLLLMDKRLDTQDAVGNEDQLEALEEENEALRSEIDGLKNQIQIRKYVQDQDDAKDAGKEDDSEKERLRLLLMNKALDTRHIVQETAANEEQLAALEQENEELRAENEALQKQPPKVVVEKVVNVHASPGEDQSDIAAERDRLKILLLDRHLKKEEDAQGERVTDEELEALKQENDELKAMVDSLTRQQNEPPPVVAEQVEQVQAIPQQSVPRSEPADTDRERDRLKLLLMDKALDSRYPVAKESEPVSEEELAQLKQENEDLKARVAALISDSGTGETPDANKLKLLLMDRALGTKYIKEDSTAQQEPSTDLGDTKAEDVSRDSTEPDKPKAMPDNMALRDLLRERDQLRLLLMDQSLQAQPDIRALKEEYDDVVKKNQELEAINAQLRDEVGRLAEIAAAANTASPPTSQTPTKELVEELQNLIARNKELEQVNENLQTESDRLDRAANDRTSDVAELALRMQRLKQDNEGLRDEIERMKQGTDKIPQPQDAKPLESAPSQPSKTEQDRQQLQKELDRLKLLLMDQHQYEDQKGEWIQDREDLESEIIGLKGTLAEQSKLLEGNEKHNEELEEDNRQLTGQVERLLKDIAAKDDDCRAKDTELGEAKKSLLLLENEARARNREIDDLRQGQDRDDGLIKEEVMARVEARPDQAAPPADPSSDLRKQIQDLKKLEDESKELKEEANELRERLRDQYDQMSQEKDELVERNNVLLVENKKLARTLDALKDAGHTIPEDPTKALVEANDELQNTVDGLKADLKKKELEGKEAHNQIETLMKDKQALEKDIENLKQDLKAKVPEILKEEDKPVRSVAPDHVGDDIAKLQDENQELKDHIDRCEVGIRVLEHKLNDAQEENDALTAQKKKLKEENIGLSNDVEELQQFMDDMQTTMEDEKKALQRDKLEAARENDQLAEDKNLLLLQLAALKKSQPPKQAEDVQADDQQKLLEENERLVEENYELQSQVEALQSAVKESDKADPPEKAPSGLKEALVSALAPEAADKFQAMEEENEGLKKAVRRLRLMVLDQKQTIEDLERQLGKVKEADGDVAPPPLPASLPPEEFHEQHIPLMKDTIEDQKNEIEKLEDSVQRKDALEDEVKELKRVNEMLTKELANIEHTVKSDKEAAETKADEQAPTLRQALASALAPDAINAFEDLQKENKDLKEKVPELEKTIEQQKEHIHELERQLLDSDTSHQKEKDELEDSTDMLQERLDSLRQDFGKRNNQLLKEIDELHDENERLQEANDSSDAKIARLNNLLSDKAKDSEETRTALEKAKDDLETENNQLKQTIEDLQQQREALIVPVNEEKIQAAPPRQQERLRAQEKLRDEVDRLLEENQKLKEELAEARTKPNDGDEGRDADEAKSPENVLKKEIKDLTFEKLQHIGEIQDLQRKVKDLDKDLANKTEENQYLQTENKDLREILNTIEVSPRVHPDTLVNQLKEENTKLQQFIDTLGDKVERISKTPLQSPRESEVKLLEQQVEMLSQQIEVSLHFLSECNQYVWLLWRFTCPGKLF